jgi:hypothetical protein
VNVYSPHCILGIYNLTFDFYRSSQLRVCLDFRGDSGFELLNNVGTIDALWTLGAGLNAFCIMK